MFETKRLIIKGPGEVNAEERLRYYVKNRTFFEQYTPERVDEYFTAEWQKKTLEAEMYREKELLAVSYYYFLKEDLDTITGTISFSAIRKDPYSSALFGYDQDEGKQGMGYCTEACKAAIRDFNKRIYVHRVEARVLPENVRSIHILEHLGFLPEGIEKAGILIGGEYKDHIRYAILNEKY